MQLWYGVFYMHQYKQSARYKSIEHTLLPTRLLILMYVDHTIPNCIYNLFPEDEPSVSKHVENIKIKN